MLIKQKNPGKTTQLVLWSVFFFSIVILTFMTMHPHFLLTK